MKRKKILKKSIFWGIILICLALAIIFSSTGLLNTSTYTLVMSAIFLVILVKSAIDLNFTMIGLSVGHGLYLYRDLIGLPTALKSWVLILCSVLIGIGFDFIFKDLKKRRREKEKESTFTFESTFSDGDSDDTSDDNRSGCNYSDANEEGQSDKEAKSSSAFSSHADYMNGNKILIENALGKQVRYIRSDHFKKARIENGLGTVTAYFDHVTPAGNECKIFIENGLGNVNLYLPCEWALDKSNIENGMGNIQIFGNPSTNSTSPLLRLYVENGMGNIRLYFE